MEEIWKDVVGYEGYYQVSNLGNVRSLGRTRTTYSVKRGTYSTYQKPQTMRLRTNRDGYKLVNLSKDDKMKTKQVHRLVAEAFIPNPENKATVNHKDRNKANNCVDNLEWATAKEQMDHFISLGLKSPPVPVVCIETGQVFPSMTKASQGLGIPYKQVRNMIDSGKSYFGMHVQRA